jgi:hypothetical protein
MNAGDMHDRLVEDLLAAHGQENKYGAPEFERLKV